MRSGENPRRFAALGNAHQDSTDCFCEQGNGGLAAKAYGSVNSIVSTIAVPLLYLSWDGSLSATHGIAAPVSHPDADSPSTAWGFPPTS